MSGRMNAALGVSGLVIFVSSLTLSFAGHAAAQRAGTPPNPITPVLVTNTPLPVVPQGAIEVSGTVAVAGPVQVQQSGPWTVDVGTLPSVGINPANNSVTVGNANSNPVPVRNT